MGKQIKYSVPLLKSRQASVEEIEFRTINETRDQAIKNIIQMERMGLNVNLFKNIIKKSIYMYSETCAIRHLSSPTSTVIRQKIILPMYFC